MIHCLDTVANNGHSDDEKNNKWLRTYCAALLSAKCRHNVTIVYLNDTEITAPIVGNSLQKIAGFFANGLYYYADSCMGCALCIC